MITFENQEAFENAVMSAIRFRCVLGVNVRCINDKVEVEAILSDESTGTVLARSKDSDTVVIYQSDIRS